MWWIVSEPFLLTAALIIIALMLTYYHGTKSYDYWKKLGVPYIRPKYPYFGTLFDIIFSKTPGHLIQLKLYEHFKGERFGGIFYFTAPGLIIRDPLLMETILTKDFTSFYNRGFRVDIEADPLSAHLLNLDDKQWKNLRQKLTPIFSMAKLKGMRPLLDECSDILIEYINRFVGNCEPIEIRDVVMIFALDVIGSCAFGLNVNAVKSPSCKLSEIAKKFSKLSCLRKLKLELRKQYPILLNTFGLKVLDESANNFFFDLAQSTMDYREKNNVVRNDFLHYLMQLKKQDLEQQKTNGCEQNDSDFIIDDQVIASNFFLFLLAGYETSGTTLSFSLFELSRHQDIQEEAYQQIIAVLKKHQNQITYDALKEMTFLHQIIAETLRMYPVPSLSRISTKEYQIPGTNLTIPKGMRIILPIYSIHHDADYFPEPEEFLPKRFSKDEASMYQTGYKPFGDGPRQCIGKGFAQMEMQMALVKLLLNFKFTLSSKTIVPLAYKPRTVFLTPVNGIWLDVYKRI